MQVISISALIVFSNVMLAEGDMMSKTRITFFLVIYILRTRYSLVSDALDEAIEMMEGLLKEYEYISGVSAEQDPWNTNSSGAGLQLPQTRAECD